MRVKGNSPQKSPGLKAAQYVAQENGIALTPDHNKKLSTADKKKYKYHKLNGDLVEMDDQELNALGSEFLNYCRSFPATYRIQTFWIARGILVTTAEGWARNNSDFSVKYELAKAFIGENREAKNEEEAQHLSRRMGAYCYEYKKYDDEQIALRAKLNEPASVSREDYLKDLASITGNQVELTEEVRKIRERNAVKAELDRRGISECGDENTTK